MSWERALAEGDKTSFAGRIKIGMAVKGIKSGQGLANAINSVVPELKINRKITASWLSGPFKNIRLDRFIALAQALDMDPEWLATGKGEAQRTRRVTLAHERLIEMYEALPEPMRRVWLRCGDMMLEESGIASRIQPFVWEPMPRKKT